MKTCLAIPARLHSRRIQHKLLQKIAGKSILEHCLQKALQCTFFDDIIVVTDSDELARIADACHIQTHRVTDHCNNGSERIAKTLEFIDADIIVNLQADEMEMAPELIETVLQESLNGADIASAMYPLSTWQEVLDPNIVKVVCNQDNDALYFSRSPIPAHHNPPSQQGLLENQYKVYGHIGIYSYKRDILQQLAAQPPCAMEQLESLEQLRALFYGYTIKMLKYDKIISVNSAADINALRRKYER